MGKNKWPPVPRSENADFGFLGSLIAGREGVMTINTFMQRKTRGTARSCSHDVADNATPSEEKSPRVTAGP